MGKVILITGASSGFGYEAAKILKDQGHTIYGVARRQDKLEELKSYGINTYKLDVTDYEESKKVVDEILTKEGKIDVLINNAGYGQMGPIEMTSIEDAKKQIEVNVFAMANMSKLVIPSMRDNKSGRIINISSVAGKVTTYFGGWYNVSKFAVEALSDSLRLDLKRFGIKVSVIEPGPFKTNWGNIASQNILDSTNGTVYEDEGKGVANFYKNAYEKKNFFIQDGYKVAKKIAKVSTKKHIKARYLIGRGTHFMVLGFRIIPTKIFDKIVTSTKKK